MDEESSGGSSFLSSDEITETSLWTNVCCKRFIVFYPIVLSPVLTISFLLSMFSSLSCNFIKIEVGFPPLNAYVQTQSLSLCPLVGENLGGCYLYPDDFKNAYISNDENWYYARLASFISMASGFSCFVMIWLMILGAILHTRFYKSALESTILIFTVSEASKVVFKKVDLCRAKMWIRKAVDGVSIEVANSCVFSVGAKLSGICVLINLFSLFFLSLEEKFREETFEEEDEELESLNHFEDKTCYDRRSFRDINEKTTAHSSFADEAFDLIKGSSNPILKSGLKKGESKYNLFSREALETLDELPNRSKQKKDYKKKADRDEDISSKPSDSPFRAVRRSSSEKYVNRTQPLPSKGVMRKVPSENTLKLKYAVAAKPLQQEAQLPKQIRRHSSEKILNGNVDSTSQVEEKNLQSRKGLRRAQSDKIKRKVRKSKV